MDLVKQKEQLIETFGVHFETLYNLPPLASRILGLLIVDGCQKGITFEELVERTLASKSSVSTSVNLLVKLTKITYYTIPGDRKKYFKPAPFSSRLSNYLNIMNLEKELIDELLNYRKQTVSCPEELRNMENVKAYRTHVLEVEELLKKTINKFKEIEEKNTKNV